MSSPATVRRIVIIGGGFGGLSCARGLRRARVDVTLIDRRNFHLFQPLLYQVATGALSPANIASPLRAVLKRQRNARVWLADAVDIDASARRVLLRDGEVAYDTLVVSAGVRHNYFGHDEWERYAPGLKTVEDATEMRRRILVAFEAAERATDPAEVAAWLTFAIVGGGPTGVELAGALAEVARDTLRHDFRHIDPLLARILLIEAGPRVLATFPPDLSEKAVAALKRMGVTTRTQCRVTDVGPESIRVASAGGDEVLRTHTVLWAAGVQAAPLASAIAKATGAQTDRAGRILVEADLTLRGHPEIYVIGDAAQYMHQNDRWPRGLPGVATVAIQEGEYAARSIIATQEGRTLPPFRYRDPGSMATIGRASAIVDLGRIRFSGVFAWLTWLFVHLMSLIHFQNRVLVLVQWAGNYITRNRSARLITNQDVPPVPETPAAAAPRDALTAPREKA